MAIRSHRTHEVVGHKATARLIEASKRGPVCAAKVRGVWDLTIAGGSVVYVEGL